MSLGNVIPQGGKIRRTASTLERACPTGSGGDKETWCLKGKRVGAVGNQAAPTLRTTGSACGGGVLRLRGGGSPEKLAAPFQAASERRASEGGVEGSGRLALSPTQRMSVGVREGVREERTPRLSGSHVFDLKWNEAEGRSVTLKKRKMTEEPVAEDRVDVERAMAAKMLAVIRKLEKGVRELVKVVRENPNTKKEIKEISQILTGCTSQLVTAELLATVGARVSAVGPVRKDASTQAGVNVAESAKVCEALDEEGAGYTAYREMRGVSWPESAFKVVGERAGASPETLDEGDTLVVVAGAGEKAGGILRCVPRVERLVVSGKPAVNGVCVVSQTVDTYEDEEDVCGGSTNHSVIVRVPEVTEEDAEALTYSALERARDVVLRKQCSRLNVAVVGKMNRWQVRKMLESVFRKSGCVLTLCWMGTGANRARVVAERAAKAVPPPRRPANSVLFTKGEGCTFAQMVSSLESEVCVDDVKVRRMRETKEGNLVVSVGSEEEKKRLLKRMDEVRKEGRCVQVGEARALGGRTSVVVRRIGPASTCEEVLAAVVQATGADKSECVVRPLKATKGGSRIAVVSLPEQKAEVILKVQKVRIGWMDCFVDRDARPVRCYRCLAIGHMAKECKGVERKDVCLRCGGKGHKAVECKGGTPKCYDCGEEGHRAGTGKCPKPKPPPLRPE